ncbi:MAG: methyltransferase domain-containing protein [Deltaproteobacteria bacterium]|nr:methyltransferase domain-containing protein [Deltaproteobacteria bacterium]
MPKKDEFDARLSQEDIVPLYNSLSGLYDIWGALAESRARKRAIGLAEIRDGMKILEVAVGTGLAFNEIVRRNPNGLNLGIDISPGMLAKAKKRLTKLRGANYELKLSSAFDLPAQDEEFDLLMNNYMFDLIAFKEMDAILAEFKRVLKKGGKLIFVNMTVGERFGSDLYDLIFRLSPKTIGGCRGIQLSGRLLNHGFQVVSREYHQQMLFPSEVIAACK